MASLSSTSIPTDLSNNHTINSPSSLQWFGRTDLYDFPATEPLHPAVFHPLRIVGLTLLLCNLLFLLIWSTQQDYASARYAPAWSVDDSSSSSDSSSDGAEEDEEEEEEDDDNDVDVVENNEQDLRNGKEEVEAEVVVDSGHNQGNGSIKKRRGTLIPTVDRVADSTGCLGSAQALDEMLELGRVPPVLVPQLQHQRPRRLRQEQEPDGPLLSYSYHEADRQTGSFDIELTVTRLEPPGQSLRRTRSLPVSRR